MLKCETIPTVVTRMLFVVDKANIIEEKSHSTRATVATRGRYRATYVEPLLGRLNEGDQGHIALSSGTATWKQQRA
jgi:hypothetical protein